METWFRRIWWAVLGILLVAAFVKFLIPVKNPVTVDQVAENRKIVVYITGAVQNSGLLELPLDARLDDALREAGLSPDADVEVLNPAQKLKDGQKIIIPFVQVASSIEGTTENMGNVGETAQQRAKAGGRININTAGLAELDTIPGIGPVLAQRIIDYREQNGFFSSPEEIQNVSGIGSKTYEKMADYITVGP
ncbi:MAG: ComEA family DNA-binding protein [Peptococcaceae bacterium]|nr:ComEA family DNA-binding protein [Peptococcaceae bacterium]